MSTKSWAVTYAAGWTTLTLSMHETEWQAREAMEAQRWRPGSLYVLNVYTGDWHA